MTANIPQYVSIRRRPLSQKSVYRTFHQRGTSTHQGMMIGFSLLVLISLSILGFMYLQQVLETASRGTAVQALENKLIELKTKQRALELESAELRSLHTIETRINDLQLVTTDKVAYLGIESGRVALAAPAGQAAR